MFGLQGLHSGEEPTIWQTWGRCQTWLVHGLWPCCSVCFHRGLPALKHISGAVVALRWKLRGFHWKPAERMDENSQFHCLLLLPCPWARHSSCYRAWVSGAARKKQQIYATKHNTVYYTFQYQVFFRNKHARWNHLQKSEWFVSLCPCDGLTACPGCPSHSDCWRQTPALLQPVKEKRVKKMDGSSCMLLLFALRRNNKAKKGLSTRNSFFLS